MASYLLRRILISIPVVLLVSVMVFGLIKIIPGDPAVFILGQQASPSALAALRHQMGLDLPLPLQYWHWLHGILTGNFGHSLVDQSPVLGSILAAFPVTLQLTLMALLFALIIGVPTGVISATRNGGALDAVASVGALAGVSLPSFWAAILLIYAFAIHFHWFPSSGFQPFSESPLRSLYDTLLPAISLGIRTGGVFMRQTRSSLLEVVGNDFIRTARAKGLRERTVIYRHALRNALIPVVTISGLELAGLLGGVVITETIFALPGMGRLIYNAILQRDFITVLGTVFFFTLMVIIVNLFVDIAYSLVDPRIKVAGEVNE